MDIECIAFPISFFIADLGGRGYKAMATVGKEWENEKQLPGVSFGMLNHSLKARQENFTLVGHI